MSLKNIAFIVSLLLTAFEMSISQSLSNNGSHQIKYTARSPNKEFYLHGKKDKKTKINLKLEVKPDQDFAKQRKKWGKECGCLKGTNILTQEKIPLKCACISNDYRKKRAPSGGRSYATVRNSFKKIKVLDVNEEKKMISSQFIFTCRWNDGRISTTFPNNKPKILITRVSPKTEGFPIWVPTRSVKWESANSEWSFFFLNSFPENKTTIEGRFSKTVTRPCNLDFTNFPFDRNRCEIRVTSKLSKELIEVLDQQNKKKDYFNDTVSAFDVYITLFGRRLNHTNEITNDFGFGFNVEIKRRISSYVIQYYLPCGSIVAVSAISFIIPLTAIPGRVTLLVTLFLTLSNLIIHHEVRYPTRQNTYSVQKINKLMIVKGVNQ